MNSLRLWIRIVIILSALPFAASIHSALADTSEEIVQNHQTTAPNISPNDMGRMLHGNELNAGFALGAGVGVEAFGGSEEHDLLLGTGYFGWIFTDLLAAEHWYGGNFEVLAELVGGAQINPDYRIVVGLSAILRYNFNTNSRWVPYMDAGFGVGSTNIRDPDLSTDFEFITQVGAGTRYFFSEGLAFIFQYRWFHLSNAGLDYPNRGTNTQMFYLGLDWFF